MFNIKLFNNISERGTSKFSSGLFSISDEIEKPHGMVMRSYKLPETELNDELLGVARAGAGTNNIPVGACSKKGIVVFNTPGANANAVKELVICGLFLASRKIIRSIIKVNSLKDDPDIAKTAEKIKSEFTGPEIYGKTLGLIGLGAIGSKVANDASNLGMRVIGYDPFLTVSNAINLTSSIELANSVDKVLAESDYISLHLPLTDKTRGFINEEKIAKMKDNVRILNFSRGEIIDNPSIIKAVADGKIDRYVTDFAFPELMGKDNIIVMPHLGASTPEAEDNCAEMACDQLREYLVNGNIINSVNLPQVIMERSAKTRITIINQNVPSIVEKITRILSQNKINISDMINKSQGEYAYNIIDTDQDIDDNLLKEMKSIEGIVKVRKICYFLNK